MRRVEIDSLVAEPLNHDAGITKQVIFRNGSVPHLTQLAQARIPPGSRVTAHKHSDMHEIFIILSGQGRVRCDDTVQPVGPGTCLRIEPGERHGFENDGSEDLVVVYFGIAE
ncbi:MAG: cupin domain-containing protein [Gammaproteobacteria bacterium]|nr:cupin domain-containing protein [Gammaproteobacteria bacterium]MBU2477791.1 cupin domain-containing protein [Gammaproteobacteria bacterium]